MAVSKIPRTCTTCGAIYYGWTGNKGLFCSMRCYHAQDRIRAIARFWSRVEKTGYCWLWTGPANKDGYGKTGIGPAHQVSWTETYGPIPNGLQICHKCNNPLCVNPAHLYLGTSADNMRDRQNAGHYGRGESHPMVIVTEGIVRDIRREYIPRRNGGLAALAKRFGIAPSTVHAIVSRKIWQHI